jgi:hypothetical protein
MYHPLFFTLHNHSDIHFFILSLLLRHIPRCISLSSCAGIALDAWSTIALFTSLPPHPLYSHIAASLKRWAKVIKRDVLTLALASIDRRTPLAARAIAFATV